MIVFGNETSDRIIKVDKESPHSQIRKLIEILEHINTELGACDIEITKQTKVRFTLKVFYLRRWKQ